MKRLGRALQCAGAALMVASFMTSMTTRVSDADTAAGAATATFVAPNPGSAAPIGATNVIISTQLGSSIELLDDGELVDGKHLGKRTFNKSTGEAQWFFYGVTLHPGPNELVATALRAPGLRGTPATLTVYGPGDAQTIRAEFGSHLRADGKTIAPLNITVSDRYGNAAAPAQRVDVRILRGNVTFGDLPKDGTNAAPASPDVLTSPAPQGALSAQVPLPVGGYLSLPVVSGTLAGAFDIEVRVGNAYLRRSFYVEPYVRPAFVTGLASVGVGAVPGDVDGDGIEDGGGARRERAAIFATGAVGRTLVTAGYESQNRLSPVSSLGAPVDSPNSRPYLTYGDSSTIAQPYRSQDHFYARVDRGRSSALWGQYVADVGPPDVGGYQQLLNGAKVDVSLGASGRARVTAFTARNQQAFISTILPLTGLATLSAPLHPDIVVGSDLLQLVTLDRATGLMIRETPLLRNVDYTIDYATGILRFINVPLPYDPQFNPQVVSLQYEYQGPGVASQTTGAQVSYALSLDGRTTARAGYVNDATGTQNFALVTQSLARTWANGSFTVSHASSAGFVPSAGSSTQLGAATVVPHNGEAISVALDERNATNAVALGYQSTSAGYNDPFGGFSSPGTRAYRAIYSLGTARAGQLQMNLSGESNTGIGAASSELDGAVTYLRALTSRLTMSAGVAEHRQTIGAQPSASPAANVALANTQQTQAQASLTYRMPERLGISVSESDTLRGSDAGSTQPSQTQLEATYDLPKRGRLFFRELWSDQPSATFANSTANLNIASGSTHSMQFGVEQPLSAATTVSSQYVIDQVASGVNIYAAAGIDERVHLGKAIAGNLTLQSANAVGAGAEGFTVLGAALTYAPASGKFRSSVSYQDRTGASSGSTVSAAIAGHISDALSAVGFIQRAYGNGINAIDDRLSVAYRPRADDRLISLFDYERGNETGLAGEAANVASFEELFRMTQTFELAGRFAYKFDGGGEYAARTVLWLGRATQHVGSRGDVALEARTAIVPGATGARTTAVAAEAGETIGRTARAAVGYNIAGSVDPSLLGVPQRKGIYITFTTLIDRIFGWGKP